jgi:hypothetical protein
MTPGKLRPVAKRVISWVWKRLNPLEGVEDEQEDGPNAEEDEVQRKYEAQSQRSQKIKTTRDVPDISKVFVAAIKDAPAPASTPVPQMEKTQVPTPPSRMSTPELVGFEFLTPTVLTIPPDEGRRIFHELQEAIERNTFNVWPMIVEHGVGDDPMEASAELQADKTEEEKERFGEIMRVWTEKEERSIVGRKRVSGGYEDVMEILMVESFYGMEPTLKQERPYFPPPGRPVRDQRERKRKSLTCEGGGAENVNAEIEGPDFSPHGRPARDQRSSKESQRRKSKVGITSAMEEERPEYSLLGKPKRDQIPEKKT